MFPCTLSFSVGSYSHPSELILVVPLRGLMFSYGFSFGRARGSVVPYTLPFHFSDTAETRALPTLQFKLFPQPAISRCGPAGYDQSLLVAASLAFLSAICTVPASRLRASRLSQCGLPASGS